jgi:hypothetical protein
MKKQLEFIQNVSLFSGAFLFLFSMVMAFNSQVDRQVMEKWLFVMFFSELMLIASCISIYVNRNEK